MHPHTPLYITHQLTPARALHSTTATPYPHMPVPNTTSHQHCTPCLAPHTPYHSCLHPCHTQPSNPVHHLGLTKTRTKTEVNTVTVNILQLGTLRDCNHLLGQTNPPTPPQFHLLPTHIPHPGQITANTNFTHLSPLYPVPDCCCSRASCGLGLNS
jgi:hypothetical protein